MAKSNTQVRRQTRASRERQTRTARSRAGQSLVSWDIPWTTPNWIGIGVGLVVIVIGYILMQTGIAEDPVTDKSLWTNASSTTIAPFVLTIGYCVILPVAIFWRKKETTDTEDIVEG